jgi:hypothetical protein
MLEAVIRDRPIRRVARIGEDDLPDGVGRTTEVKLMATFGAGSPSNILDVASATVMAPCRLTASHTHLTPRRTRSYIVPCKPDSNR